MTSDAFQEFGNVEVTKEQLMMSVNGPRITGRQSLMIRMLTLSGPGDLLEGIDDTIRSTCEQVTRVKLNSSSDEFLFVDGEITKFTSDRKCWFELHMALYLCSLRSRRLFFYLFFVVLAY